MRQTLRSAGIFSLFLLTLTNLSAEPILRGFFIEKLPGTATTKRLEPGKGLVLAHVFNSDNKAIKSGEYLVGVEIDNAGKKSKFAVKPEKNINSGTLKTFRMAVPLAKKVKDSGSFRVFSKIKGETIWSEKYSFLQGVRSSDGNNITTLYTEAPPEPEQVVPPNEIRFEGEKKKKSSKINNKKTKVTAKKSNDTKEENVATVVKPETKKAKKVKTAATKKQADSRARKINSSEFKTLRTIDEELVIYVIKKGDSLRSIAEKYYGKPSKERAIADLNFIEDPSSVRVGEEIIIDVKPLGKSDAVTAASSDSSFSQAFTSDQNTYTIKRGDTLGKIAKKYFGKSSAASRLMKANPGVDPRYLKVGDVIIIPENKGDNA
ncbi:MAG: LysM peptidoglycan-binding domain-containing protein [Candidatus Rifleibacteriota bacterium]